MPPPSPVWAWKGGVPGDKVFSNATFRIFVRIEGRAYESNRVTLKVKGAPKKTLDDE